MDRRDGALGHAIVDGAIRRWLTLEHLLQAGLRREFDSLDHSVRGALLAGAAQVALLDGAPARAIVHETVEWAKGGRRPEGAKIVNAGLRRLVELFTDVETEDFGRTTQSWEDERNAIPLASGRARVLATEILPEDRLRRLSVATGCPVDLLRLWSRSHSLTTVRSLALHTIVRPPVILNVAHTHEEAPPALCARHDSSGHRVFTGDMAALQRILASRADLWVQDPAASGAVESVRDLEPRVIVDVCAGRGTKTRQLAFVFPDAEITATDVDGGRRRDLAASFEANPRVSVVPPRALGDSAGRADLVLLDVPCSNTGVLARRVEARHRVNEDLVASLIGVQRQILADSVRLLAPGGKILYSTCSLDPRENEDQLEWACRWHGFRAERVRVALPSGGPGAPLAEHSDGAFSGLLL